MPSSGNAPPASISSSWCAADRTLSLASAASAARSFIWNFGPERQCGAIYQPRLAVSTKNRGPSANIELDVAQHRVVGARDLVLDERAAPGAGELPEHRPVVYVAAVVAEVGGRLGYLPFAPPAGVLFVVA